MNEPKPELASPEAILHAIEKFRSLDLRYASQPKVHEAVELLRETIDRLVIAGTALAPHLLWRLRRIKVDEKLATLGHLWEPPPDLAELSRCNAESTPLLYCSSDILTPFQELDIKAGECVLLIEYESKAKPEPLESTADFASTLEAMMQDLSSRETAERIYDDPRRLKLHRVVGPPEAQFSCRDDNLSYRIFREFVREEFTRPVGRGTEFLYRISSAICTELGGHHEGWIYPSVVSLRKENLAIQPGAAHEKLRVKSARVVLVRDGGRLPDGTWIDVPSPHFPARYMFQELRTVEDPNTEPIRWIESDKGSCRIVPA